MHTKHAVYTVVWITYRTTKMWGVHVIRWTPKNQSRRWQRSSTYWDCRRCAWRAWRLEWRATRRRHQSPSLHHQWVVQKVHGSNTYKTKEPFIP